jgi:5'-nucleotidase
MNTKPHILITNDDGVNAPGIKYLWEALKPHANLTVVAPSQEQSGVGLSITIREPLQIKKIKWATDCDIWYVTGTPADCVKLALSIVLKSPPDLVISGINRGSNAGRNVFYSGTVAAAIEGVMHDIPAVALSCYDFHEPDYETAALHAPSILEHVLNHPMPAGTLLNVNFPKRTHGVKGFKMTRQGKEFWMESPEERSHPIEGHRYYWLGSKQAQFNEHEESDIVWLEKGYVTAVPVHIGELTDHQHIETHQHLFEKHFCK